MDERKTFYTIFALGLILIAVIFGSGIVVGIKKGTTIVNETTKEVEYHYNNTVITEKEIPCQLTCLDARNEGYLEGVAECKMNEIYIEAKDGRIRSYIDNVEGFYSDEGVLCVQTEGRTTDSVLASVVHELIHREQFENDISHFCGGTT